VVFSTKDSILPSPSLETMKVGSHVECGVIDLWSVLLNHKEAYKSKDSPCRFFGSTDITKCLPQVTEKNETTKYEQFAEALEGEISRAPKYILKDILLV
jgi:hypothetical protein